MIAVRMNMKNNIIKNIKSNEVQQLHLHNSKLVFGENYGGSRFATCSVILLNEGDFNRSNIFYIIKWGSIYKIELAKEREWG